MNTTILPEYFSTPDAPNKETLRECISMQQKAACYRQINQIQKLPEKIQVDLAVLKFIVKSSLRKCPESKKNQERVFVPGDVVEIITNNVDLNTFDSDIWFFVTKPKKNTHKLWKRNWSEIRKHLSNNGFCSTVRKMDVFETGVTFEEARIKHFCGGRNVTCYKISVYEGVKPIWFEIDIFKKPIENFSPPIIFDSDDDESSGKVCSIMNNCLKRSKKDDDTKITDQIKPLILNLQTDGSAYQYSNISALLQEKQGTSGVGLIGTTLPPPPPLSQQRQQQMFQSNILQTPQIAVHDKSNSLESILKDTIDLNLPKSTVQLQKDTFGDPLKKDTPGFPQAPGQQSFDATAAGQKGYYPMFPQYQQMSKTLPPIVVENSPSSEAQATGEYPDFKPYFSRTIFSSGSYQLQKGMAAPRAGPSQQQITSSLSSLSKQPTSIQEIISSSLKKISSPSLQLPPPPPPPLPPQLRPSGSLTVGGTGIDVGKGSQIMNSPVTLASSTSGQGFSNLCSQGKALSLSSDSQLKQVQAESNNASIQNNILNVNERRDYMSGLPPICPSTSCDTNIKKY